MNEIFNLSEITSKAETLISQLSAAINALTVAAEKVNELENEISSQSNQNLNVSEKELKSQLEQARKEKEKALAKTNEYISQLKQCYTDIQKFMNNQQQNLQILQSDRSRLSQPAGEQYRTGERAAQQDIKRCEELLQKIESVINNAQNTISSVLSQNTGMKGKSEIIEKKSNLPYDLKYEDTAGETISLLDKERNGLIRQQQNIGPSFGDQKNIQKVTFGDDVSLSVSYSIGDGREQKISMPVYFNKIVMGGGSPKDNDGRYPAVNIITQSGFSQDSFFNEEKKSDESD